MLIVKDHLATLNAHLWQYLCDKDKAQSFRWVSFYISAGPAGETYITPL